MITTNAYAKINWSLSICGELPNGYHGLDMLMQRISLCDRLTFESSDQLSLIINGTPAASDEDNLVLKAAKALNAYAGTNNSARIHLEKHIPARAGLGGGSADCASTLIILNDMWKINAPLADLERIGLSLGADVPYCIRGCFCRAQGIGEILTPISPAPELHLVLVTPGAGLSTPRVFRRWSDGAFPSTPIDNIALAHALAEGDFDAANRLSHNDLEAPAIDLMPEIADHLKAFRHMGARFVRMTGSGSTVFAVFDDASSAEAAASRVPGAMTAVSLDRVNGI